MAEASSSHDYLQLSRISRWHVESDTINRALAVVISAQSDLPMAAHWGGGITASGDRPWETQTLKSCGGFGPFVGVEPCLFFATKVARTF